MFPLECYLNTINKRQGLGFQVFGVVVDKRLLRQLALAVGGAISTGLSFLLTLDESVVAEERGCCLRAVDNETCATTLGALIGK